MINGEKIIRRILAMSVTDAYKVLGFPQTEVPKQEIDKRYRYLALQLHPDRGGKLEDMQRLNVAKDVIDGYLKGKLKQDVREQQYQKEREERQKQEEENKKVVELKLKEVISFAESYESKFINYFKNVVNIDVDMSIKKKSSSEKSFTIEVLFKAEDGTHFVIEITYWKDNHQDVMYIESEVFYKNKVFKMDRKKYEKKDITVLIEPSNLFPESKIKKIIIEQKQKQFKKQDAEATLKRELGAKSQGQDFWQIPINEDPKEREYILVYRNVIMRYAAWNINGLYKKMRRVAQPVKYITYMETLEQGDYPNFKDFINVLKEAIKGNFSWKEG